MSNGDPEAWAPSRQLRRGNAAEQIFEDLREHILRGTLARGDKLPTEKSLASAYGVSGATAREAMRSLATAQLVEVRHGSGAFVTADADKLLAVSLDSMMHLQRVGVAELLDVLGALNTYAGEIAARRAVPTQIAVLRESLADMEKARDVESLAMGLRRFLDTLAQASANPLLVALCRYLTNIQVTLAVRLSGNTYESWRRTTRKLQKERALLVDAIESGDPVAARQAARAYHERSIKVIGALPHAETTPTSDRWLAEIFQPESSN